MQVSELLKLIKPDVIAWIQAYALGGAGVLVDGVDMSTFNAAPFVTMAADTSMPNERVLTAGGGLTRTDGGPGGNVTLDVVSANAAIVVSSGSLALTLDADSGMTIASGLALGTPGTITTTSLNAVSGSSHTHAIDSTIAPSARILTAGAGMTGGGDLTANRTFDVVSANTAIVVNANDIAFTLAANSGMTIASGAALGTPGTVTTTSLNAVSGSSHTHAIDASIAGALLVIEEDEVVSVASVTELRVTIGKLTDNGGGSASLDLTGDGVSVSGDTDPVVPYVKALVFPDGIYTDLGGGVVYVDTRNVLSVAEPGDDPRVYRVTEMRFPDGWVTDLGDGNVEIAPPGGSLVDGSGTASRLAVWSDSDTLAASSLIKSGAGVLTLDASTTETLTVGASLTLSGTDGKQLTLSTSLTVAGNDGTLNFSGSSYTLTVPGTGTAALNAGVISVASDNSVLGATGAAPSFTSGTAVSTSAVASSIAAVIPASASIGEPLLAAVVTRGNTVTVTTPAGWVLLRAALQQTNVTLTVFTRITRTGDPGDTVTFNFSGSVNASAVIVKATDALAGEFVDAEDGQVNSASTSLVATSIDTEINNCRVMVIGAWGSGVSCTPDGSTTELVEKVSTDSTNNVGLEIAYYTQATAGTTGTKTHTLSGSAGNIGMQVAFRPAASGGHQHHIGATYRPGADALLKSDAGGGLSLAYLGLGDGALAASGRQLTMKFSGVNVGIQIASSGGSGKTYAMVADTTGNLIIQDDSDASPSIKLLQSGSVAIYPDVGQGIIVGPTGGGSVPNSTFEIEETKTLSAGLSYGRAGTLTLDPGYTGAFTVTKHIYQEIQDVSVAGGAAVTDAVLFYFDAALGTHKATTSSDKTANAKVGTIKVDVNGTIRHIQLYAT